MKTSRSERDYIFGSAMMTLRTAIRLKQADLANLLGISRLAVGKWEGGINYPKAEHLKKVIALGVKSQAFPAGREAEEIRALWKASHQKVLLDEDWLSMLLSGQHSPRGLCHEWLYNESAHIAGQAHGKDAVVYVPHVGDARHISGAGDVGGASPPLRQGTPNKMREQRQWLTGILITLVVLTIVEFGRSAFLPGKR